jgi:hypothetical protein
MVPWPEIMRIGASTAVREADVHHIRVGAMGMGAGFADRKADGDGVAFSFEDEFERAADIYFVIDNEDATLRHRAPKENIGRR